MEVTYKNTTDDLFYIYWYRKLRNASFYAQFLALVIMISYLRIPQLRSNGFSIFEIVFSVVIYTVTVFILFILFLMIVSKFSTSGVKVRESLKRITMTLQEDCYVAETMTNTDLRDWTGIVDIRQEKRFIFLFIEGERYYAIPKRAFPTVQAAEDFYQTAYDYWQAAKEEK